MNKQCNLNCNFFYCNSAVNEILNSNIATVTMTHNKINNEYCYIFNIFY